MTTPHLVDPCDDVLSYSSTWDYGDLASHRSLAENPRWIRGRDERIDQPPRRLIFVYGWFVGVGLVTVFWWLWMTQSAAGRAATSHRTQAFILAVGLLSGAVAYLIAVLREDA